MTEAAENCRNESPSQTAGPYLHIGCTPVFAGIDGVYPEDPGSRMIDGETLGERITIAARVYDGNAQPLTDALIEIWQADASGRYPSPEDPRGEADPNFSGWGRAAADSDSGVFVFETIKPGAVPYAHGRLQAPHITFWIVARGINVGLHTRMYFGDEAEANAVDPILAGIEPRQRTETLMAHIDDDGLLRFDIRLQGADETVFFDL